MAYEVIDTPEDSFREARTGGEGTPSHIVKTLMDLGPGKSILVPVTGSMKSFRSNIYMSAKKKGVRVFINSQGDKLMISLAPMEESTEIVTK